MSANDFEAPPGAPHFDRFRIGDRLLIRSRNLLQGPDGSEHVLEPRAVELLAYLAMRPGEVVALEALHDDLWAGRLVTDSSIYRLVAELRRLLGDDARSPRFIETVRKRGYRLVAPVTPMAAQTPASSTPLEPQISSVPEAGPARGARAPRLPLRLVAAAAALLAGLWLTWSSLIREPQGTTPSAPAAAPARATTLAVLPLERLTPSTPEWLAQGLARTISDRLAAIPELSVIAYPSVREALAADPAPAAVAAALGAGRLLSGTVVADDPPDRVRISVSLVTAQDGVTRWAGTFDAPLGDVLSLYERLAADVAGELDLRLAAPARAQARVTRPEAIAAWMRGLAALEGGARRDNLELALAELDAALEQAPDFVPALAARAVAHTRLYLNYHDRSDGRLALARADVDAALAQDPDGADARYASGYLAAAMGDVERAELQLRRALERQPGSAEIHAALGRTLSRLGEQTDAVTYLQRAVTLDPLNGRHRYELALQQMFLGRFAAADDNFLAAIVQQPEMSEAYLYRAWLQVNWLANTRGANTRLREWRDAVGEEEMIGLLLSAGLWGVFTWTAPEFDEALAEWSTVESGGDPAVWHLAMAEAAWKGGEQDRAADHFAQAAALRTADVAAEPDSPWLTAELAIAHAGAGEAAAARRAADRAVALDPVEGDEWDGSDMLWVRATVLSMLGDHDAALAQIEEAARYPTLMTPNAMRVDPHWAWLETRPEFDALAAADGSRWRAAGARSSP